MDARVRAAETYAMKAEKTMINANALEEIGLPGAAAEYRKEAHDFATRAEQLFQAANWKPATRWSDRPSLGDL